MSNLSIPDQGRSVSEVLAALNSYKQTDVRWREGRTFCLVYHAGDEHLNALKEAYATFPAENALNPNAFPSLRRIENEVVRMAADLMHGDSNVVGTMTSGGTESILMAVKTARDLARSSKRRIKSPNMVVPESAHVAFDKAGKYFGVEVRYARLRDDYRVDLRDVRRLLDRNTVLLVGSAPQYVQGVVDSIVELGQLAMKKKLPLHVDACVGGFHLPFLEKAGCSVPLWDFRVPGVTSISADLHKFGYATKGASVVLYRDIRYLRHQFFVSANWPGGIYASPSLMGTRSGGALAAAWASLQLLGQKGFLHHTQRALTAREKLLTGLSTIPELEVVGQTDSTIVSFKCTEKSGLDTFALADALLEKNWFVDRQQKPPSIHCTCMSQHAEAMDEFVQDVKACVDTLRQRPSAKNEGWAPVYGMMAKVPFRGMVYSSVLKAMENLYGPRALETQDPLQPQPDESVVDAFVRRNGPALNSVLDKVDSIKRTLGVKARRPRQRR